MFGKLKSMFGGGGISIPAPVAGEAVALSEVSDPTFAQGILGQGCAIKPTVCLLYTSHLGLVLAYRKAREGALYDERGNALGALGRVGHCKYNKYFSNVTVSDEDLRAVEDIVVALENCGAGALRCVRTSVGLGQAECAYLVTLGQHAQVLLLLLFLSLIHISGKAKHPAGKRTGIVTSRVTGMM